MAALRPQDAVPPNHEHTTLDLSIAVEPALSFCGYHEIPDAGCRHAERLASRLSGIVFPLYRRMRNSRRPRIDSAGVAAHQAGADVARRHWLSHHHAGPDYH